MYVLMCGICGLVYTGDKEQYKASKEVDGTDIDIVINAFRLGNFNKRTGQWTALTSDNDICPNCASAIDQCIEHLAGDKKIKYHKAKERKKSGRYSWNKNVSDAADKVNKALMEQDDSAEGQSDESN